MYVYVVPWETAHNDADAVQYPVVMILERMVLLSHNWNQIEIKLNQIKVYYCKPELFFFLEHIYVIQKYHTY